MWLIHFGGWKKLQSSSVTKKKFNLEVHNKLNIEDENILDIYGFSEQLGTVYISKGQGEFLVSNYSTVLVRDPKTLKILKNGQVGFLQFLSILPLSYPGFSILNDDMGFIASQVSLNNDEKVKFKVLPRIDGLDLRGCGDTLPENYYI